MKALPKFVPGWQEITREALIVVAGALLAAVVVGQVLPPSYKAWIKRQWD